MHGIGMQPGHNKMDHEKMGFMKSQDNELRELVTQMNQAQDKEKVELMAEVLTRLVQQRSQMHEHCRSVNDAT